MGPGLTGLIRCGLWQKPLWKGKQMVHFYVVCSLKEWLMRESSDLVRSNLIRRVENWSFSCLVLNIPEMRRMLEHWTKFVATLPKTYLLNDFTAFAASDIILCRVRTFAFLLSLVFLYIFVTMRRGSHDNRDPSKHVYRLLHHFSFVVNNLSPRNRVSQLVLPQVLTVTSSFWGLFWPFSAPSR